MLTIRGNQGAMIFKNGNLASCGLWIENKENSKTIVISADSHVVPIQAIPDELKNSSQMILNELIKVLKNLDNSDLDLRDIISKMID